MDGNDLRRFCLTRVRMCTIVARKSNQACQWQARGTMHVTSKAARERRKHDYLQAVAPVDLRYALDRRARELVHVIVDNVKQLQISELVLVVKQMHAYQAYKKPCQCGQSRLRTKQTS